MTLLLDEVAVAASRLAEAGVESPRTDAELIAAHVHGVSRGALHTVPDVAFDPRYWDDVARRASREPLQHITGLAYFRYLELEVGPGVFVPRPETEVMTGWAIEALGQMDTAEPVVADLGTGSGAIALAIAQEVPGARVHAVEADPLARQWTERNIARVAAAAPHTAGRVTLHAGDFAAALALRSGELVVLPTDTLYGIGADAFYPSAVNGLLAAKGRGRDMPPPVLVGTVRAATALIEDFGPYGKDLIDEFWPGGLTLVCRANRSLNWDLGDTQGTVAVRMPLHPVALELLKETGPLAVSSANLTGSPPATPAAEAQEQLGDAVSVYLDSGPCANDVASTIVDLTGNVPRLLRAGTVSVGRLREVAMLTTGGDTAPSS